MATEREKAATPPYSTSSTSKKKPNNEGGGSCISTWDMRKAFDTVHPDFVRIALQRMGLDDTHADYYVRLNSSGRIIVRSPHAQHHLAQHGHRLLSHIDDPMRAGLTYFTAGRGIGQGDVTSAIIWLLVFDVLLNALDIGSTDSHHPTSHRITTCSSNGLLRTNNETCFSDDLNSISPSFAVRQRKADIVSAFAIMFKLTIAQDKIRCCTCRIYVPTLHPILTFTENIYIYILYICDYLT